MLRERANGEKVSADSADSAYSAAYSADSADSAAASAAYKEMADKLIELLAQAPEAGE